MADVELLPLPELPRQVEGYSGDYWEACQVEEYATDYARACVEANIAPLQAENERLLAEVERLRRLVQERDTMLGKRLCAGANADGKPRCLALAEEHARAERLRAEVEHWRHKAAVHQYRRERLAEALREAEKLLKRTPRATRDMYVDAGPIGWGVQAGNVLAMIRAALAKENKA